MERGGDTALVANMATQAFAAGLFVTDPPLHSNSLACFTGTTRKQPTVADMDMSPTRLRATRGRCTHALFSLIVHEARSLHPLSTRTKRMKEYAQCVARSERRALIHFKYTSRPSSLISAETHDRGV